jgi:hypothetical protein
MTPTSNEIARYIDEVNRVYQTGNATEHSYRPALQRLLENIAMAQNISQLKTLRFTNEPKRIICGAPDYIVTRKDIPVGYIEAKDIGIDLNGKANKEQFDRYKQSLDNIIFTDYLEFHQYTRGELTDSVRIADISGNKISSLSANFEKLEQLIKNFGTAHPQGITSPADIAGMMAGKARFMAGVIENVIENALENKDKNNMLVGQMDAFKEVLIHDIKPQNFADVYAQTIAYGLFAARLHDESPDTFSRQKASSLIPKTNPFLQQLFYNIAGPNLDDRIVWIVDDLADTFRAANMSAFKKSFGERTPQNDPMIYFYESFLSAYDPALRKSRGVWYTPYAAVAFIVRAVDEILQKEFKLPNGLADTSKVKTVTQTEKNDTIDYAEKEVHKVQILDPAAGTGTFLAETISLIFEKFRGQSGMWQSYVEKHLISRLNGFELLMASYTMAHIKIEHLLTQTGYTATDNQRLRVYLTNSLEEYHVATGTPFAEFLAREASEANGIKRDTPIMVVMGNPPYSGESQNKSEWIMRLMDDYKKEPPADFTQQEKNLDLWLEVQEQSAQKLYERNSKWINDDYCKFIRLGQYFVDKNNEGILAYINNHSFLDNPTFRGMRWSLMKSFDKIYIVDLHGNNRRKEVCPDGSKDENVFDKIQQGVSINIFVKTGRKAKGALAEVYHIDVFGKREEKYKYLRDSKFSKVKFTKLKPSAPEYFFVPKDYENKEEYDNGFGIEELFSVNSVGIVTAKDSVFVNADKSALLKNVKDCFDINPDKKVIQPINYRPFDRQYVYYDIEKIERAREKVMSHLLNGENIGLMVCRQQKTDGFYHCLVHKHIVESSFVSNKTSEIGYSFPLYLYHDHESRKPNLNETIISEISQQIGLRYVEEKEINSKKKCFAPIDILDYIYAILHSPAYRERYKEFLKIDFPRIPYPEDAEQFRKLSKLGRKLRSLHLLEDIEPQQGTANYPITGSDEVEKIRYEDGKVFINSKQYFDRVPLEAWEFYIGGYQPAQKWLKDRKGRKLEFADIEHYRKIIWVLSETGKVMREIEM